MEKYQELVGLIEEYENALIAFSGGVDSSVVAKVARNCLSEKAIAVTLNLEIISEAEVEASRRVAREIGIRHIIIRHEILKNERFVENSEKRCYYCKREMMEILKELAERFGIKNVLDGTNADDMKKDRPGLTALKELEVKSPLAELNIGKKECREIARFLKLSNYDKPSVSCLATRIPYGERITLRRLRNIESGY